MEEYDNEVRRAHAENRAPVLHDPRIVASENLGNAESHLVEKSKATQDKETKALLKQRKDALKEDATLREVIRGNTQRVTLNGGTTQPYQAPDPERYSAPESDDEKAYAERQVDGAFAAKNFHDFGSDQNIPNLSKDGQVLGDSVNPIFTRNMTTFTKDDLIFENEKNAVPAPERFRETNPPLVIQQGNPLTGEPPVPESGMQHWRQLSEEEEEKNPSIETVPHTAISVPYPEHVIGDETGTTRDPSRVSEKFLDSNEELADTDPPLNVPISQAQVFQGAVKRPETMDGGIGGRPADSVGARPIENSATEAVQKIRDEIAEAAAEDERLRGERMIEYREMLNEPNSPEKEMERFNEQQNSQTVEEPEPEPEPENPNNDEPDVENNPAQQSDPNTTSE
jgi:hypothetical protein